MSLVTDSGNSDSIKGVAPGRQAEDWAGVDSQWRTKLKVDGSKSVFYGVRQSGTSTELGKTRTVGFDANVSRKIDLVFTSKADIEPGTYTITINLKQQTGTTSSINLQSLVYEIVIKESLEDKIAPTATLTGFNSNSLTLSLDEEVKMEGEKLEDIIINDKVSFIKSLFVANEKYDLLDVAMNEEHIEIVITKNSITLTLNDNALKQTIFKYLDSPDHHIEGYPVLAGNKDGMYRMDAEINLDKFSDLAGNKAVGEISNPFKIQYNVTVNDGTPDYESAVVAKFVIE